MNQLLDRLKVVKKYLRLCKKKLCCCLVGNENDESASAMQRRESYVEMNVDDAFDDENVTSGIGDVNRVGDGGDEYHQL